MPYCRDCGKEVMDDWVVCPYCGSSQSNSEKSGDDSQSTGNPGIDFTDSAMSGDIHHTVINNDVEAVTNAVLTALDRLGVVNSEHPVKAPAELVPPEMAALSVGESVDYYSPTNSRWLDACQVIAVNSDGTYDVTVPKSSQVETKYGVVIGDSPGTIRPAVPFRKVIESSVTGETQGHSTWAPSQTSIRMELTIYSTMMEMLNSK